MWILAIAALAAGLWYYEAHKSPAAVASGRPVLDANMPKAAQDALIAMVAAQTDPAELDKAAALLASAPPPGPYPLAAAWVKQQAAALRAQQKPASDGLPTPAGHTPVTIPSHSGGRPPVHLGHPTILANLFLQGLQFSSPKAPGPSASMSAPPAAPLPTITLNLKGKTLMNLAWTNLMKKGFAFASWVVPPTFAAAVNGPAYYDPSVNSLSSDLVAWRNLYILGNLEEPTVMADPDAKNFWQNLTLGNPFFSKGTSASKALGWG